MYIDITALSYTLYHNFTLKSSYKFRLCLVTYQRETKLCGNELYLCYYCNNPAVMIECGFLSNPEEAAKLTNKSYQQEVAFTVFSGIAEFTSSVV